MERVAALRWGADSSRPRPLPRTLQALRGLAASEPEHWTDDGQHQLHTHPHKDITEFLACPVAGCHQTFEERPASAQHHVRDQKNDVYMHIETVHGAAEAKKYEHLKRRDTRSASSKR